MKIYFVTSNKNKFTEAKMLLGCKFELKQIKFYIPELQSDKVAMIVKDKALKAYEKLKKPIITEDTALYIKSWNGFPGPFISWVVKTMGVNKFCEIVKGKEAYAECFVAYYDGKQMKIFRGYVNGKISEYPKGKKRFDWDRIFIPYGYSKTFAEMDITEKNSVSHRAKAFKKLKDYLEVKYNF